MKKLKTGLILPLIFKNPFLINISNYLINYRVWYFCQNYSENEGNTEKDVVVLVYVGWTKMGISVNALFLDNNNMAA